jgi:amino acid transporter
VAPAGAFTDKIAGAVSTSRKLSFLGLVSVIFFTVSGGGFGVETLVGQLGPFWAIALVLITPMLWSLPIALMVSELASAMPEEGGYFVWVRRALGDFWAFQEGWWKMCFSVADMAIFPVLFVNYLAFFFPDSPIANGNDSWESFFVRWGIAAAIIFAGFVVNYSGVRFVGYTAVVNVLVVLVPFVVFSIGGLAWGAVGPVEALRSAPNPESGAVIALGLATVLWNYCGWDNVSTYAGEVRNARRNYPRALLTAVPLTIAAYLIPILAGVSITTDPEYWSDAKGFPEIAELIGFGKLIAVAALISTWSLFNSQLLYSSRLPFAMAEAGWLPKPLAKISDQTKTPVTALAVCCVVAAVFAALPFTKLVLINILFLVGALALQFIAFLVLRRREPNMDRPFKVGGGRFGPILITVLPAIFATVVVSATLMDPTANLSQLYVVAAATVIGLLIYLWRRSVRRKAGNP